jgi:nicotinate-nucleotide pyrophosphorylase (carboxylating)
MPSSEIPTKTTMMPMDWNSEAITSLVRTALAEDIGPGDATTAATIPESAKAYARIVVREPLVCAGLPLAERVFHELDPSCTITRHCKEGKSVPAGKDVARISGRARAILSGERTALNFLARLSGIATLTREFAKQLAGTRAKIHDTRKTTPLLRALEKYAVRMGGGENHRFGLFDAILLKENHITLAGGIAKALAAARAYSTSLPVQVEVRNEAELAETLSAGADSILLDNMSAEGAALCVSLVRQARPQCIVEVSGGITLANARAYALTGADYLSSGALTHSAPAANLSLLVESIA